MFSKAYLVFLFLYKIMVSPIWSKFAKCKFYPTCSEYSRICVEKYGIVKGLRMTFKRLSKCRIGNYDSCIDMPEDKN